jgi:hypothetical protein
MGKRARAAKARIRSDAGLVELFREACRLKVELDMTPAWRWRKRRRLDVTLGDACDAADVYVIAHARAGADVTPLRSILDDPELRGPEVWLEELDRGGD